MITTIFNIITYACLTYLFVYAEPIILIRQYLNISTDSDNKYIRFIARLLGCCLCSGFWIGLIITQNIYLAAATAITAETITKKIQF